MRVYMDNGATTRVTEPVMAEMAPYFCEIYGNPSSAHGFGRPARKAVEAARARVARAIGADAREIFFTGCGTESDNWALRGAAYANRDKGRHIITSSIEHHAVLNACEQLEREGFEVTYLRADEYGIIAPEALENAIRPDTSVVSVMLVNNEIGTIEPVAGLSRIAHAHGALFHTDAVQAIGHVPIDVGALGVDMLSMSGHKFHAPKGVGALYVRTGVRIDRLMHGGAQERAQRPGTENVAGIVGMGRAIELATGDIASRTEGIRRVRDRIISRVLGEIPGARLNGHPTLRACGNISLTFPGVRAEAVVMLLDMRGVAASAGPACTSGSPEPSHVLRAIGLNDAEALAGIRLSLSDENTLEEADYVVDCLKTIIQGQTA